MASKVPPQKPDPFSDARTIAVPLLPLRDVVIFPNVATPIAIRRERSLTAVEEAMASGKYIAFVTQKDPAVGEPSAQDLYRTGTIGTVREVVKQDDGSVRALIEGTVRIRIRTIDKGGAFDVAAVERLLPPKGGEGDKTEALTYSVLNQFRRIVNMGANVPFDVLLVILNVSDPWYLCDLIGAHVGFTTEERMAVLTARTAEEKLQRVAKSLGRQEKVLQMASEIQAETGKELDKMQREMYLREQMKSVERELAQLGVKSDIDEIRERIENADLPETVRDRARREHDRLKTMSSFSPESAILRTYLDWITDLPWGTCEMPVVNMEEATQALDDGHDGLKKVKERVLEHIAVQKLVGRQRGPILCFIGPPGTGKTSIGRAVAKALGRTFHRISLGGIRDEAEIRGHRRTYVGALPGRIIQGIAAAKSRNPVFMLDEIDKLASDFRGDPASALLEALDPEQNAEFSDHYLEIPFDLSDTMFIMTANRLDTIPPALLDRMEIIEFSGYTDEEKLGIAKTHLIPKVKARHGLGDDTYTFTDPALRTLIAEYTREAGVRELERTLSSVCRKLVRASVEGGVSEARITPAQVAKALGPAKYTREETEKKDIAGVATGLAWTETGGEILHIEATVMPGKGALMLTGQLGDVMQESAKAALSYVRASVGSLGITRPFHKDADIHVHVPSGGIPKDGPSAGVAVTAALVSALTGRPLDRTVCMTGEITLRGRVLEIGGVKEKVLAAHRAGLKTVILPQRNKKDLDDVPSDVRRSLRFVFAEHVDDALSVVFSGKVRERTDMKKKDFARQV